MINWKGYGRQQLSSDQVTIPAFISKDKGKHLKLIQDSWCQREESNRAASEYTPET
jgi:hypothetical protein